MPQLLIHSTTPVAPRRRALGRGLLGAGMILIGGIVEPALAQVQSQTPIIPGPAIEVQIPHPPGPSGDVPPEFAGRGCRFFVDESGQGPSGHVAVDTRQENGGVVYYARFQQTMSPAWSDNISAVQCDPHCSAVLYDQQHLAGPEIFTPDGQGGLMSMANSSANNRASSVSIFCVR